MAAAQRLAAGLRTGDVVCLRGVLGAGKSVFARALIRAACGVPAMPVPSPTFTLVQIYDAPGGAVWHFDLYRIADPEEIDELGWEDALAEGIALVEWPERLDGRLPPDRLEIAILPDPGVPERRTLVFTPYGRWAERGGYG